MFEKATRLGLRFTSTKGQLSVEDLWNLPLTSARGVSLDGIAKGLHKELKESDEISFVEANSSENELLQLKFDIVKHIIQVKLIERQTAKEASAKKQEKETLMAIIATKKQDDLQSKSIEELEGMLKDL